MDTSLTSYFTSPSSLHPTLSIHLTPHFPRPPPHCHLHTFIHLPDSLFFDPYELQDTWGQPVLPERSAVERVLENRRDPQDGVEGVNPALWYLTPNNTDLERPVYEGRSTILDVQPQTTLHLVLDIPSSYFDGDDIPSLDVQIPLHARYLQPSSPSSFTVFNSTFLLTTAKQALGLIPNEEDEVVIRVDGGNDEDADVKVQGWWVCINEAHKEERQPNSSFLSRVFRPPLSSLRPQPLTLHPLHYLPPSSTLSRTTTTLPKGNLSHLPLVQLGTVLMVWVVWVWVGREVWRTVRRMNGKKKKGHVGVQVVRHRDKSMNDDGL